MLAQKHSIPVVLPSPISYSYQARVLAQVAALACSFWTINQVVWDRGEMFTKQPNRAPVASWISAGSWTPEGSEDMNSPHLFIRWTNGSRKNSAGNIQQTDSPHICCSTRTHFKDPAEWCGVKGWISGVKGWICRLLPLKSCFYFELSFITEYVMRNMQSIGYIISNLIHSLIKSLIRSKLLTSLT